MENKLYVSFIAVGISMCLLAVVMKNSNKGSLEQVMFVNFRPSRCSFMKIKFLTASLAESPRGQRC